MSIYTAQDKEIVARIGGTFQIELESNPTTGYEWQPIVDKNVIDITESSGSSAPHAIGGRSHQRFTVRPLKPGDATIKFVYKRPWESKPLNTHTFHIHVKP